MDVGELADLSTGLLLLLSMGGACSLRLDAFSPSPLSVGLQMDPSFRFLLFPLLSASLLSVAVPFLPKALLLES